VLRLAPVGSGCAAEQSHVRDCPVEGDSVVALVGGQFSEQDLSVTVGLGNCEVLTVNSTVITCKLPAGVGVNPVSISQDGSSRATNATVTYSAPTVASLESPACNSSVSLAVTGCPRAGFALTITGNNFVPKTAISIGGMTCANVSYIKRQRLTCMAPHGATVGVLVVLQVLASSPECGVFTLNHHRSDVNHCNVGISHTTSVRI
jgi:hypothetical protein